MPYLTAMISAGNDRSIRVAERLGLTPLRDDVLLDDPVVVYTLLEPRVLDPIRAATRLGEPRHCVRSVTLLVYKFISG